MQLNDKAKTIINVENLCWVRSQEEQMAGHGGMVVRFTGGGSTETLEYDDPKQLDDDLKRINETLDEMEI